MKHSILMISGILAAATLSSAQAFERTEYVCSFDTIAVQMETQKETETTPTAAEHKISYRVKLKEVVDNIFQQDGSERRIALVQKGYYDGATFKVTGVQSHEVVKQTRSFLRNNVTEFKGEFFQLQIENRDEFPSRVFFDAFGSEVNSTGKCLEN